MLSDAISLPHHLRLISGCICAQIFGGPSIETALLPQYEMAGWNLMHKWITVSVAFSSHSFLQIIQPQALEGRGSF